MQDKLPASVLKKIELQVKQLVDKNPVQVKQLYKHDEHNVTAES
jgi:hypothetical protein